MNLEGEIGEINLVERLVELGGEQFTGAIRFENDGVIKIIYFKGGDILSASTNDRADSVDEILLRAGKVTREHVKQALAKRKENETLGDALLTLGFITRKELTWGRRVQVIGVIRSVAAWPAGSYTIVNDYLPKREEGTLFPLQQLILELLVTEQDRGMFDRALEGGEIVLGKPADFDAKFSALGLNEEADAIVASVDGFRTAAEVAEESGKDTFNAYKLLHALRVLGLLHRMQGIRPQAGSELSFDDPTDELATAGVADAADMWSNNQQPELQFDDAPVEMSFDTPASDLGSSSGPGYSLGASGSIPEDDWSSPSVTDDEPSGGDFSLPEAATEPAIEASSAMPSWDAPTPRAVVASLPAAISNPPRPAPANDLKEDGWGFDEAQLETSRLAAIEDAPQAKPKQDFKRAARSNRGAKPWIGLLAILLLAAGGYAGLQWWTNRAVAPASQIVARPRTQRPPLRPGLSSRSGAVAASTSAEPHGAGPAVAAGSPLTAPATAASPTGKTTGGTVAIAGSANVAGRPSPAPIGTPPAVRPSLPVAVTRSDPGSSTTRIEQNGTRPTITNSGVAAAGGAAGAAGDVTKRRYDELAQQNLQARKGSYTVQFELVCETASITRAMATGGAEVWFVPITYRGRSCYRVFWGHFDSKAAAAAAMGSIPRALREATPVVVSVPK